MNISEQVIEPFCKILEARAFTGSFTSNDKRNAETPYIQLLNKTPCLSTPVESTPESSPAKICSVKSLPGEKGLDFFTFPTILHNLFYPGKNTVSLIVPSEFLGFTR